VWEAWWQVWGRLTWPEQHLSHGTYSTYSNTGVTAPTPPTNTLTYHNTNLSLTHQDVTRIKNKSNFIVFWHDSDVSGNKMSKDPWGVCCWTRQRDDKFCTRDSVGLEMLSPTQINHDDDLRRILSTYLVYGGGQHQPNVLAPPGPALPSLKTL
jgi:hypothetical protein